MTTTRHWLEARRQELVRLEFTAGTLATVGGVLVVLGAGVLLARGGLYLRSPWVLIVMWLAPLAVLGAGVWWFRRRARSLAAQRLASGIEAQAGLRRGSLAGVAGDEPLRGSGALAALADRRATAWLSEHGDGALESVRERQARVFRSAVAMAAVGAVLFATTRPTSGRAAVFWNAIGTMARARGPISVSVDRREVRRGERVAKTPCGRSSMGGVPVSS